MKGSQMAKLGPEQVQAVAPVIKELAATTTDKAMVALIKEKTGVDVSVGQITEVRKGLGIRKTRGRNSRVLAEGEIYVPKAPRKAKKVVAEVAPVEVAPAETVAEVTASAVTDELPF